MANSFFRERRGRQRRSALLLIFLLSAIICRNALAEGIQASYLQNSDREVLLELNVEDPPPSSIIVLQMLPAGVIIQRAEPSYSTYRKRSNEVRWLFKFPRPGVKRIHLWLSRPLPADQQVRAVIRCMSPETGALMTITLP